MMNKMDAVRRKLAELFRGRNPVVLRRAEIDRLERGGMTRSQFRRAKKGK